MNFFVTNNVLEGYDDMKEEIKNLKNYHFIKDLNLIVKHCYHTFSSAEKKKDSKNLRCAKKKSGRIMLLSKCAVCGNKKPRFITEEEASGALYSLSKIFAVFFVYKSYWWFFQYW